MLSVPPSAPVEATMGERFGKLRALLDKVQKVAPGPWKISGISLDDGSISISASSVPCIIAYVTNAISFGDFVNAAIKGRHDFGAQDTATAQHDHADLIVEARNRLTEILAALDAAEARVKRLEEALASAKGYMLNAKIDIETGTKKRTTLDTLTGGLRLIDAALAKEEGGE